MKLRFHVRFWNSGGNCDVITDYDYLTVQATGSLAMVRVLLRTYRSAEEEEEVPVLGSSTGPGGRTVMHAAVLTSIGEFLLSSTSLCWSVCAELMSNLECI